jgi:hypothetical protein
MKEWNGFKEFGQAEVIKEFVDDSGQLVTIGTIVNIADITGPNCFEIDIAWPDNTLVGGNRFTTASTDSEHLRPM